MNSRILHRTAVVLIAFILLLHSGCGKPVKLVPAKGVVVIKGKPAAGISVQFLPEHVKGEHRPTSFALTDDDGNFVLTTSDGKDGAVPGPHVVLLSDTQQERPPQGEVARTKPRLSGKRATVAGGVRVTVPDSAEPIVVSLDGD
ncbi:MAG: hypothetical protein WCR51_03405 [Planctomycetia bacterium]